MALCKAMIFLSASLLVPTISVRLKQLIELTSPEGMMNCAGDCVLKKNIQAVEQDQDELAQPLVEEDVSQAQTVKVEEDELGSALGESFTGPEPPRDPSGRRVKEQAKDKKGQKGKSKDQRNSKGKDKGNDAGKDKARQLVTSKGKHDQKAKDASRDKAYQLVKSKGHADREANAEIIKKVGQLGKKFMFRFPLWGGKWWIARLAFLRGPFVGFIYQEVPGTKTLLIKSLKALEEFGDEAILPQSCNYVGADVGDKITFNVKEFAQEGTGKPRPMARDVIIRQTGHAVGKGIVEGPALTDVRTQVLYYISDDNLRTDKFFQDIIAATQGGWISTDFFLLCRRLKKLGASTKSIIESLRDVPAVEIRDTPGQEAVRRTSPPPPLEPGVIARKDAVFPVLDYRLPPKKRYTTKVLKNLGDLPDQNSMEKMLEYDHKERAKAAGPEADDQEPVLALAQAEVPESPEKKKGRSVVAKRAVKKQVAKSVPDGDVRPANHMARARSKKEEKARERAKKVAVDRATAKKAAVEKPAAKKALSDVGRAAIENSAAEKAAAFAMRRSLGSAADDQEAGEGILGELLQTMKLQEEEAAVEQAVAFANRRSLESAAHDAAAQQAAAEKESWRSWLAESWVKLPWGIF